MPRQSVDPMLDALLDAALGHVPFDGWSPVTFDAAVAQVAMNPAHAKTLCPRGAADLAVAYHKRGDAQMIAAWDTAETGDMRIRDRVATLIKMRLAGADKEAVRRGSALFALPHMAADGAKLIWGTADAIWTCLGDTSQDVNWYTKRATLSAVYGSVVLFWLGDDGSGLDDFIDRRIDNVMQIEKVKAQVNDTALLKPLTGPLGRLAAMIKAPTKVPDVDLPGIWRDGTE